MTGGFWSGSPKCGFSVGASRWRDALRFSPGHVLPASEWRAREEKEGEWISGWTLQGRRQPLRVRKSITSGAIEHSGPEGGSGAAVAVGRLEELVCEPRAAEFAWAGRLAGLGEGRGGGGAGTAGCCVLCAVCCVLCAVCCVLCAVCCVLCALCCVLCALCCVLCAVCCVLCALCSIFDGLPSPWWCVVMQILSAHGNSQEHNTGPHTRPRRVSF
ncbi:hypothetical protein QBC44DRAFT_67288 [Cladorrhinum sp. PSN332]|nr:hypothetical protein QBC44DRAFT_67288 [Cladorrhinum sp. PSN332]